MDNIGLAKLLQKRFLYIILFISLFLSCLPKEEVTKDIGIPSSEIDSFSGHYFNSTKDHLIKSIEIFHENSKYSVSFHSSEGVKTYSGVLQDNEIVVEVDDKNAFHLYLNIEELRMYKIVKEGYQPEDIEWTFYSKR